MILDEPNFSLDAKSIHKLSTKGLSLKTLKEQIDEDLEFLLQLWHSQGLEIVKHQGSFYFATKFIPIKDAIFCIVDIETNGSKIDKHQIIEIAAVKVKNGKIIDSYESLVNCKEINPHITEITGITAEDTKDAPVLKKVMYDFKVSPNLNVLVSVSIPISPAARVGFAASQSASVPLLNCNLTVAILLPLIYFIYTAYCIIYCFML